MPNESERRKIQRFKMDIPARISAKESVDKEWNEMTHIKDVSSFGAGFLLKHIVKRGQLLNLIAPIPSKLRCYDQFEQSYRVWGLVRRVTNLSDQNQSVGVAFTGPHPPASYLKNPKTYYDLSQRHSNGLWQMIEYDADAEVPDKRRDTRLQIPISVLIEQYDSNGNLTLSENTITENISVRGTCVYTSLSCEVGSFVRFTSDSYNVSILSAVHDIRRGSDDVLRLHLEFIDQHFPLDIS